MAVERRCGPWRDTWLGRVRRCNNPLLPERGTLEVEATPPEPPDKLEPQRETTPASTLPERKNPPAIERVPITDRTHKIARKLISSVFSEGETTP